MLPASRKATVFLLVVVAIHSILADEHVIQSAPAEAAQAPAASDQQQQEESYQRVYEAFTKLLANVGSNSLGNARRLVSRLNQLVGTPSGLTTQTPQASVEKVASVQGAQVVGAAQQQQQTSTSAKEQSIDEKTEQILTRLDGVNKETDQNTLNQLNNDVSRLISTLNDSYLRNIRRVIERVNKIVGSAPSGPANALHQSGDRFDDPNVKQPGFPGFDEIIMAVDRVQKSFAHFVRSSTRLVTSG